LFDFDRILSRQGTSSIKWDRYAGKDIIPMWVADMDFPSPPAVTKALKKRAEHPIYGYTHVPAVFIETICGWLEQRYSWKVNPGWLVCLPGLVTGINISCRAVGEEGDEVVTTIPVYPPFLSAPENFKKRCLTFPMLEDGDRWVLDEQRFRDTIGKNTRLFLFCSPHNPCGRLFTREEQERMAAICLEHDIIICSDEIHCDLILKEESGHLPTAVLDEEVARRTITLMAPSKTFNIPGLGCSFAVIPDKSLRQRFLAAARGIVPHINVFGYVAAQAAYNEGREWLDAVLVRLRQNRDAAVDRINGMPGLRTLTPEATYLLWIDCRDLPLERPAAFFEKAGVGLSCGRDFGTPGFVRLNFACPPSVLERGLERMERAVKKI